MKDYSSYGPAYRNFVVKDDVFVPQPFAEFSGTDPYVKMAAIRGEQTEIAFDETYPYLDNSFKFKFHRFITYFLLNTLAFPLARLRYGLKVEGRENLKENRHLLENGAMTICNHVFRWDMICILYGIRFRRVWIPMYRLPFQGKDNFFMRTIGGIPIPEDRNGLRCFNEAFDTLNGRKAWIHIFPESCSWNFYAPIRPLTKGAFNMAYKYAKPIIPCTLTFRERKGIFKYLGNSKEPLVTIHIGKPLVPDTKNLRKDEIARLRNSAFSAMLDMAGIVSNPWPATLD